MPVGEWVHFGAFQLDHSHDGAFPDQWHAQHRPQAERPGRCGLGKFLRLGLDVSDVNGSSLQRRSARDRSAHERTGKLADHAAGSRAVMRDEHEAIAVKAEHVAIE